MKRRVIGVVFCAALLVCCTNKIGSPEKEQGISVKVLEVKVSEVGNQQNYVGTVEEVFSSLLSFEVSGNVNNLYVREGQKVHRGQLIASLDKTMLTNNHTAALSALEQAKDVYQRMKILYENNSLPEIKWIEVQTALQQAESVESNARKNLNDCNLYAPFPGIITERNVESGTNVLPGMTAFKLVSIDKVKIKIAVPEKEISNTRLGQTANIRIAALGNKRIKGKISEKNVIANPLSHTYEVKIELDNPDYDLMPGMVCNVNVNDANDNPEKIILPVNVVQVSHTGENFVWLAIHNHARRRIIETGGFSDNGVIVSEGLTIGEQVIIEGNQKVNEGMKIFVR